MEETLSYTVKKGDGYLSIARYIFSQSPRPYIKSLTARYDLMKEAAAEIETEFKTQYLSFKLTVGQKLKLQADPGHYIPRLSTQAKHGSLKHQARKKATHTLKNDYYFVIHSTVGNMDENEIKALKKKKPSGAGHAYITKKGDLIQLWPYNSPNGWATKVEKFKRKDVRGKLVNIELIYGAKEQPTEEQYQTLADVYVETQKVFNKSLAIAAHREIDRGIPNGHKDPIGFKFEYFYDILRNKGVKIDSIPRQSQIRFNQMPWCEHEWVWPPVLTGLKFKTLNRDKQIAKGCTV